MLAEHQWGWWIQDGLIHMPGLRPGCQFSALFLLHMVTPSMCPLQQDSLCSKRTKAGAARPLQAESRADCFPVCRFPKLGEREQERRLKQLYTNTISSLICADAYGPSRVLFRCLGGASFWGGPDPSSRVTGCVVFGYAHRVHILHREILLNLFHRQRNRYSRIKAIQYVNRRKISFRFSDFPVPVKKIHAASQLLRLKRHKLNWGS